MNKEPEVINENRLFSSGYMYKRSKIIGSRTNWDCVKVRDKECHDRAISVAAPNGQIAIAKGPDVSPHEHPQNREESEAEKTRLLLKRKAVTHEKDPPAALVREELAGLSAGVLSQLPERENLKQSIRQVRKKDDVRSPRSLADLEVIPEQLIFGTRRNIELLCTSPTWFFDGTFQVY